MHYSTILYHTILYFTFLRKSERFPSRASQVMPAEASSAAPTRILQLHGSAAL